MPTPVTDPPAGALDAAARLADRLRWFFLPLALCALVAVGVHTAADALARGCALAAVLGLVGFIAWRAVVHALVRADARSDRIPLRRAPAFTVGLPGALLLLPLALAALRAAPLLSFLR